MVPRRWIISYLSVPHLSKMFPQPVVFYQIILPFSVSILASFCLHFHPALHVCQQSKPLFTLFTNHCLCQSVPLASIQQFLHELQPTFQSTQASICPSYLPIKSFILPFLYILPFVSYYFSVLPIFHTVGGSIPGVLLEQNLLIAKLHTRPP